MRTGLRTAMPLVILLHRQEGSAHKPDAPAKGSASPSLARQACVSIFLSGVIWSLTASPSLGAEDVADLLVRVKAVGREGAGNVEAAGAWRQLAQRGPESLLKILAGLDNAD